MTSQSPLPLQQQTMKESQLLAVDVPKELHTCPIHPHVLLLHLTGFLPVITGNAFLNDKQQ